ncbi:DUF6894 family protein [Methylobacterium gnaphalii]|uniref:DUF6894 domain-containing protein n=1 Tax=Methylobacterium gnaphalii TaxID=1010610 RepID=A0A512JRG9_9HYPH|nr:hypothetical protein [Methylobacterium gnaphalii]GEP12473.1 hypothetical protein MGN01_43180 [Methylobacterium gnaphalii]GJD71440.1 hypothetical protein MMMDOFMJ_4399 [Methylobacterium gnaphalii]GLS50593.1 hypothetical protein GCM10007885_34460 [Methylobacterium gnaphalii]
MPARFHFDLEQGTEAIRDEDGVEVRSLSIAIEQAQLSIDELRETGELADGDGWTLVIRDERGTALHRLSI